MILLSGYWRTGFAVAAGNSRDTEFQGIPGTQYLIRFIAPIFSLSPLGPTPSQCQDDHTDRIAKLNIVSLELVPRTPSRKWHQEL